MTAMFDEISQNRMDKPDGVQKRLQRIAALNVWRRIGPASELNWTKVILAALINRPVTDGESHSLAARLQQIKTALNKW